ncbi:unnamed protein product [Paramecium octaurelia]|uniref:Uncharacterized protein n=1 Tax=Paramecium octaurelia TaxID=43137 RepID=A0A8S1YI57_PAROT|nr:unnamed protein product [Paramecium octaurelia]
MSYNWLPKLSKDGNDKEKPQVSNELRKLSTNDLMEGIFILYEEIKRLNRLQEIQGQGINYKEKYETSLKQIQELSDKNKELENVNQELKKLNQELYEPHQELKKLNEELFVKYKELLSTHDNLVQHFESIMNSYKDSTTKQFYQTIESKQQVLEICKNIQIHIQYESDYQDEVRGINQTLNEIYIQSKETVDQIKILHIIDDQIINRNQPNAVLQQQKSEKINNILSQVKAVIAKSGSLLEPLNCIKERSSDENQKQQILQTLSMLQLYQVSFEKLAQVFKDFTPQMEKQEKLVEYYKEQLRKKQKDSANYQIQMENYKRKYEKITQSRRQNQLNQSENQNRFIKQYFQIYQEYFTLILDMIEIQNVQIPEIVVAINSWKQELKIEFTDLKSLIELAKKQNRSVMQLANYITQGNKLKDILCSQSNFFKTYSKILDQLSQS